MLDHTVVCSLRILKSFALGQWWSQDQQHPSSCVLAKNANSQVSSHTTESESLEMGTRSLYLKISPVFPGDSVSWRTTDLD